MKMKKETLLEKKLPNEYEDCSDWFSIGVDNVPEWVDFLRAGKTKEEYERFCILVSIENMKRYLSEIRNEEEKKEGQKLINEAIDKYNKVAPAQPI